MRQFYRDTGIVLKKKKLLKDNRMITILSRENGKINLIGYGVRQILSKRLSHLETGNYISFTYYKKNDYMTLGETELIWGFSKIKRSDEKLNTLFFLFFILDRILPESQVESEVFEQTITVLRRLNNAHIFAWSEVNRYLNGLLLTSGFVTRREVESKTFNTIQFIEQLINRKIAWAGALY